jgi:threonyl-tRNA synthetase
MIKVTLPDGSEREYADGASPLDVAESISKSLAKKALAAKVDGEMWDLVRPLEGDANVAIITDRDPEGLELIRHDAAHVHGAGGAGTLSGLPGHDRPSHR